MGLLVYERYIIAHDALMVLTAFIPGLIIFFCSLCMARRRRDPARTGFTYLKVALAFFVAYCFIEIFAYAVVFAYSRLAHDPDFYHYADEDQQNDTLLALLRAQDHGFTISNFLDDCTDIIVFMMIVRIGNGCIISRAGEADALGKLLKFVSYGAAVVLGAIAIAFLGVRTDFVRRFYTDDFFDDYSPYTNSLIKLFNQSRQLHFSFKVLVFVLALVVVARAIMIMLQSRTEPRVKSASNLLVVCCFLWLLRTTYNMAIIPAISNIEDFRKDKPKERNYLYITSVIFSVWPQFILLTIAFVLGAKKNHGLWSTEQPFMMVNPDLPQTAWGYGYEPAQAMPPTQQQPQHTQQAYYAPSQGQQQYSPGSTQSPVSPQSPLSYQQPYYPTQQYPAYGQVTQARSPPPHEDAMGFNHQADGTPPQASPQPYPVKN